MAWLTVGLFVFSLILGELLRPKPDNQNAKRARAGEREFPTAEEGRPLTLLYGRTRVNGANVVWQGRFESIPITEEIKSGLADQIFGGDKLTLGYRYKMGVQFVLGCPGDSFARLKRIYVGDRVLWEGDGDGSGVNAGAQEIIDEPNILGGWLAGGGILGPFYYQPGTEFSVVNPDWRTFFGNTVLIPGVSDTFDSDLLPSYQYQATVNFASMELGESPNAPVLSFEVQADTRYTLELGTLAPVGDGDANPAAVLYDLLTHPFARLGLPDSQLDVTSFTDAGATLETEDHGMSATVSNEQDASSLIQDILSQIDGVLFEDPSTRKITLRLIREDYSIPSLPVFDESNIIAIDEFSSGTFNETVNTMRVNFTDRVRNYSRRTAMAQDLANVEYQGKIKTATVEYPYCHDRELASRLATRDLRSLSRPLIKARVRVNRDAYNLRPGDAINFGWSDYGITSMIFRVGKFDLGNLNDGTIVLDLVQDVFAVDYTIFTMPTDTVSLPPTVKVITDALVVEAPRWIQQKAVSLGKYGDVNAQRMYYLAKKPGEGETTYEAESSIVSALNVGLDTPRIEFPSTASVLTNYGGTSEPYDSVVGLVINNVVGDINLAAITSTPDSEIEGNGVNLIYVGDELMSFETATDIGGGSWRLTNVWRALADTVPVDHAVGEDVYFLTTIGLSGLGSTGYDLGNAHTTKLLPRNSFVRGSAADALSINNTIELRTLLPYPVADLRMSGDVQDLGELKAPDELFEGGMVMFWTERNKETTILRRGDGPMEIQEAGVTYEIQGKPEWDDTWRDLGSIAATPPVQVGGLVVPSGPAGHGTCAVRVRTARGPEFVGPALLTLRSWQNPAINIEMAHWRNLLQNVDFETAGTGQAADGWTENTGTAQIVTTGATRLGQNDGYIRGDGIDATTLQIEQEVPLDVWEPDVLSALLTFYSKNHDSDSNDTVDAEIAAISSIETVLGLVSLGVTTVSVGNWDKYEVSFADLPAGTVKLRIRFSMAAVTDTIPSSSVAWPVLRVGQRSAQLLLNPSFQTGTASWSVIAGSFSTIGSPRYEGSVALIAGSVATATIRQDVSCPPGFEYGTAVLECARANNATLDTMEVKLQALDVSNAVLTTAGTGSEEIIGLNKFERRTLSLKLPDDTTQVRVEIVGTRVSGVVLNSLIDDCDLRIFKELRPTYDQTFDFSAATEQKLPSTKDEWERDFPLVAAPDLLLMDGVSPAPAVGDVDFEIEGSMLVNQKAVGLYDGTDMVDSAYEFLTDETDGSLKAGRRTFANFNVNEDFTALIWFKWENVNHTLAASLMGRIDTQGWSLEITSAGVLRARLEGDAGTATATGTKDVTDGGWTYGAIVHDSVANTLSVIDESGITTVSTAAIGGFHEDGPIRFRIGKESDSDTPMDGQVARVYMWSTAESQADIDSLWGHAGDPTGGELGTYTRTGRAACVVGEDDDGVLVSRFNPDQYMVGYDPALDDADNNGLGLVCGAQVENLLKSWRFQSTRWSLEGGAARTLFFGTSVEGFKNSVQVTSDNTAAFRAIDITVGGGTDVLVVWFARSDTAHSARISLYNSSGVQKETHDYAVTTKWQRFEHRFTSWDASTADCRVHFYGSNDGTSREVQLSPPMLVTQAAYTPVVFPASGASNLTETSGDIEGTLNSPGLPKQFNSEGELTVFGALPEAAPGKQGMLVNANNGANSNDRRQIRANSSASATGFHYTGTGTSASASSGSTPAWNTAWEVYLRWNRALLYGQSSIYASIAGPNGVGITVRGATWTESLTVLTEIDVGHDAGSTHVDGIIRKIVATARESQR